MSELDNGEGKVTLSDLRSTTWEDGAAKNYRFNSQNYLNEKLVDTVDGQAERQADDDRRHADQAEEASFDLEAAIVFPTEHMRRIIEAARAGKTILEFPVYDGSETGEKVYNTLTVIGRAIAPGERVPTDAAAGQAGARRHASAGRSPSAISTRRAKSRRADPGLCDQLRALRERHLARAGARLQRLSPSAAS